jgi:hypothetical protein
MPSIHPHLLFRCTYSEIVWLLMGMVVLTRANARRLTGLPNTYAMTAARMVASWRAAAVRRDGGTRAAQVAADARLEETGMLRRTIAAGPTGSRSRPLC